MNILITILICVLIAWIIWLYAKEKKTLYTYDKDMYEIDLSKIKDLPNWLKHYNTLMIWNHKKTEHKEPYNKTTCTNTYELCTYGNGDE